MRSERSSVKRGRHVPVKGHDHLYKSQRADGSWVYEVRHPQRNGRRPFEVVCPVREKGALAKTKARRAELFAPTAPANVKVGATLTDAYDDWLLSRQVKPRSAETFDRNWRLHIEPRLGRVRVRDLDVLTVERWVNGLRRVDGQGPLSDGTRRQMLATLELILTHGVRMGALASVPKLERRRRPKHQRRNPRQLLTADEEQALLANFSVRRAWMIPIVHVALGQAMRLGEVCGLQWTDLNFVSGTVTIRHNLGKDGRMGTPKGGVEKTIMMTDRTRAALLPIYMAQGRPSAGFVFRNSYDGARQPRDIQRAFTQAVRKTDLDGMSFHKLRHVAITRMADAEPNLVRVRDFARHANIATTNTYLGAVPSVEADDRMRKAI